MEIIILVIVTIIVIHLIHAVLVDNKVKYNFMTYESTAIAKHLDGYKVLFISDIHDYSLEQLEKNIDYLNQLDADLLLLGGDFPSGERLEKVMSLLSKIRVKDGIYGVDGNHDRVSKLFPSMVKNNMVPLDNSGLHIQKELYVAGVADLRKRTPNVAQALSGAMEEDFVILLSHNPDSVMKQDTSKVNLTLSGHTHGGEITFFGWWKPIFMFKGISKYGLRFSGGWAKTANDTDVYVSTGMGTSFFRIYAPLEIVILTLKAK